MKTAAEVRRDAALLALQRVMLIDRDLADWHAPDDVDRLREELKLIEAWLRRRATADDAHVRKALDRELGRKVRPTGQAAKNMIRYARKKGLIE